MPARDTANIEKVAIYGGLAFGAYWLWTHRQVVAPAMTTPPATTTGGGGPVVSPPVVTTTPAPVIQQPAPQIVTVPQYIPIPVSQAGPVISPPTQPIVLPSQSTGAPSGGSAGGAVVQTPYGPVVNSNFNQPTTGPVATCLQRKPNWNQGQCETRLSQLVTAYNNAIQQGGVATKNGDTIGAQNWLTAAAGHRQDYHDLTGVWL